jgi:hypothetical protein
MLIFVNGGAESPQLIWRHVAAQRCLHGMRRQPLDSVGKPSDRLDHGTRQQVPKPRTD